MKLLCIVTGLITVLFVAVRLIELKKLAASIWLIGELLFENLASVFILLSFCLQATSIKFFLYCSDKNRILLVNLIKSDKSTLNFLITVLRYENLDKEWLSSLIKKRDHNSKASSSLSKWRVVKLDVEAVAELRSLEDCLGNSFQCCNVHADGVFFVFEMRPHVDPDGLEQWVDWCSIKNQLLLVALDDVKCSSHRQLWLLILADKMFQVKEQR